MISSGAELVRPAAPGIPPTTPLPAGLVGPPGPSAYEVWLSLGNVGTESQFIGSLQDAAASFAASASASARSADASANIARSQATNLALSVSAASRSAAAADGSATAAGSSASAAASSATGAAASATSATTSAGVATTASATAGTSATAAQGSASAAAVSATSAAGSATSATSSATAAAASATTAGGSATAASTSATNASGSAAAASASAVLSQKWAMQTSGTVDGTYYSARYYAQQAAASAASAAAAGAVSSVNGKTGAVVLAAGDISGFATVATSGQYADLAGRPSLAAVATSGSASDLSTGTLPGARLPAFTGGDVTSAAGALALTIGSGVVTFAKIATAAVATLSDALTNTASKLLSVATLWAMQVFVALTDAATIAVDLNTGLNFKVTLGGNRTLGNPTNAKEGQSGVIRVLQDATGSRTLSYGTSWDFGSAGAPTLQTAAGKEDLITYVVVDASTPRLRCSFSKGA